MSRRRNIFDFASKELTATAFWAWVLDAELADDSALRALNADLRQRLDLPADAQLANLELEKNPDDPGLRPIASSVSDDEGGRNRIDILATYRLADGELLHLVIENKTRRDGGAVAQVVGYRDRLQQRVANPVRAALFTFDTDPSISKQAAAQSITVFALSDMVELVDKHKHSHPILAAYAEFLGDKLTVASASPMSRSGDQYAENLAKWAVVADQRGIQTLLADYVTYAEQCGYTVHHAKGRSIFLTLGTRSPVVSVHPSKSSASNGLWFGISVTNLSKVHNFAVDRAAVPVDFAWQASDD